MVDWSKLPDLVAVGLLAGAFVSVARRGSTPVSTHWLIGWLFIFLHFLAFMFSPIQGFWGDFSSVSGTLALIWAGLFFIRASVPYRQERSSIVTFGTMLGVYSLYIVVLMYGGPGWLLNVSAALIGAGPLLVLLLALRRVRHSLRFVTVGLQCALAAWLLTIQHRPTGGELALNGVLFTVYLSTSVHFWLMFRRATAGAVISISGFFLWASVFLFGPAIAAYFPNLQIQSEVWNLPKYVVAVGMILVLLEDQIAHNKHLALHDELTGLPNRRLFHDRFWTAIERARRAGVQTALLTIDLDHFKQVNDTMGHHAGDLLLQNVAALFSGRVRRSDTVARTGGDEFAVILDSPTSFEEAALVGCSLLALLNEPMPIKDRMIRVGASLGIAVYPVDGDDIESLCIKADLRMYDDKRSHNSGEAINPHVVQPAREKRPKRVNVLL